jgi:GNAT superfamily N-acetyltransferase
MAFPEVHMKATLRRYTSDPGFTVDFNLVRDFLLRINANGLTQYDFPWGRWEWAFSLPYLDEGSLDRIGVWEAGGRIVGLATYEDKLGSAYYCLDTEYGYLKREMLLHARKELSADGKLRVLIPDVDDDFQHVAMESGFIPTAENERNAVYDIDLGSISYRLPQGYSVKRLADGYDIRKYSRVLWRGFNHPGEPPETEQMDQERRKSLTGGPHVDLGLKIAVVSPQGEYVSYCGMWYEQGTENALVEPVATDPDHRLKGLGRAAVLEGIRQCGIQGAKRAIVGSSQQFYYSIGFRPLPSSTWWALR